MILEYYLLFCLITTIYAVFKLYMPAYKLVQKDKNNNSSLNKHPIRIGIIFTIIVFIIAPLIFLVLMFDKQSAHFIDGFTNSDVAK